MEVAWEATEAHCGAKHLAALRQAREEGVIEALKGVAGGWVSLATLRARVASLPRALRPHVAELLHCIAGFHDESPPPTAAAPAAAAPSPGSAPSAAPSSSLKRALPTKEGEADGGEEGESEEEEEDDASVVTTIDNGEGDPFGDSPSGGANARRLRAEWTEKEEAAFLLGLKTHERDWGAVQKLTRNRAQLRTHYRYLAETFSRNREREQLGKEPARRVGHRGRPRSEATKRVLGEAAPVAMTDVMRELGAVILELEAKSPMLGTGVRRRPTRMRVNPVPGEGLMTNHEPHRPPPAMPAFAVPRAPHPHSHSPHTAAALGVRNAVIPSALPKPEVLTPPLIRTAAAAATASPAAAPAETTTSAPLTTLPADGLLQALASRMRAELQS